MTERHKKLDTFIPLQGKNVLVAGLGKTGQAAARFFLQHGARISLSDNSSQESLPSDFLAWIRDNRISCETGGHSSRFFTGADLVFVSPGIPLSLEVLAGARKRGIPVTGELAVAARFMKTPAIGITGTNGKTTVTTLLGEILQAAGSKVFVGGNIGTPLLEYCAGPQDAAMVVVEVSSFQLDTGGGAAGIPFKTAILLNISPDHLERYTSFASYAESKFTIFAAQGPDDFAILNGDDPEIMGRRNLWPQSRTFFFGRQLGDHAGASIVGDAVHLQNSSGAALPSTMHGEIYDLGPTSLASGPNRQNAAAAILGARLMGCSAADVHLGLASFKPLAHRMTLVAQINGVSYIDDSKATNVGAVSSALESLDQPVILIAGGRDKGGDYTVLNELVQRKVRHMILIGEAREAMARAFLAFTKIERCQTLAEAVSLAASLAVPGDAVLLSPACASFDMFTSYAERGDLFQKNVLALRHTPVNPATATVTQ